MKEFLHLRFQLESVLKEFLFIVQALYLNDRLDPCSNLVSFLVMLPLFATILQQLAML